MALTFIDRSPGYFAVMRGDIQLGVIIQSNNNDETVFCSDDDQSLSHGDLIAITTMVESLNQSQILSNNHG